MKSSFTKASRKALPPEVEALIAVIRMAPDSPEAAKAIRAYGEPAWNKIIEIRDARVTTIRDIMDHEERAKEISAQALGYLDNIDIRGADDSVLNRLKELSEEAEQSLKIFEELKSAAEKIISDEQVSHAHLTVLENAGRKEVMDVYTKKNYRIGNMIYKGTLSERDFVERLHSIESVMEQGRHSAGQIQKTIEMARPVFQALTGALQQQQAVIEKILLEKELLVFSEGLQEPIRATKPLVAKPKTPKGSRP